MNLVDVDVRALVAVNLTIHEPVVRGFEPNDWTPYGADY